jgi:signal transduction histidine kinase
VVSIFRGTQAVSRGRSSRPRKNRRTANFFRTQMGVSRVFMGEMLSTRKEPPPVERHLSVVKGDGGLLERVGVALNSSLELWEVLRLLAGVVLDRTGAHRCSVFLLDGKVLHPTAAIGASPDENLWSAFRAMGPIDMATIEGGWELLAQGRAVPIAEAADSPLIPDPWVEAFCLKSVALVPLHVIGEPCGLMAVDFQQHREFSHDDIRFYEAIASHAGVAVRNARLYEATKRRSELQEGLARAAAALVAPLTGEEIGRRLVDAFAELFGARLCAIALVDADHSHITTVGARGTRPVQGRLPVSEVPQHIVQRLRDKWWDDDPVPFGDDPWLAHFVGGADAGATRYLVFPLKTQEHLRGGILLGFDGSTGLDDQEVSVAYALADIATAALERGILLDKLERQLKHMQVFHDLGAALAEKANVATLIERLNRLLGEGIEVTGLVFKDRTLARRLGGEEPTAEEKKAWRSRHDHVTLDDATLSVSMRLGRRIVGSMRVRTARPAADERAFLEALGHGVAEVASRGAMRSAIEEAERERAVSAERGRIAADLHDTAGQLFVAIGLLARRQASQLPDRSPWIERFQRLANLADRGKWEINQAIQALSFFPAARRGLHSAVRSLARSFEDDSSIPVLVEINGTPKRLSPRVERALYRVAHEALMNAWRHARCSAMRVEVSYASKDTTVRVVDDGVGMTSIGGGKDSLARVGIAGMRRAMDEVGGDLRIRAAKPRGTIVEARVTKEGR